ncbi:neuropeptide FF receptor 2-like [Ostrea edulis]|uniref:neuropeptide FF receptor 2-like n=1 Tax=Ostrea edulis TaxID=37623 RepID=UPI0020958FA6|nr:neuropeptide FF receptor 2-like [Ostrea edulis]
MESIIFLNNNQNGDNLNSTTVIPEHHSNETHDDDHISEFSAEMFQHRLPNTVIMALMMFFGIIGNSVVLYVYFTKLSHVNMERYFIPFLAIVDLVACLIGPSFALMENVYSVTFPSAVLCKTLWYVTSLTSGISVSLLFIIAAHRHRKLCCPHKKQMTVHHKRMFMAIMFITVAVTLTPMIFFVDLQHLKFEHDNYHVEGITCAPHNPEQSLEERIYFGIMFGMISLIIIATGILYVSIGKVVFERLQKTRKSSIPASPKLVITLTDTTIKETSRETEPSKNSEESSTQNPGGHRSNPRTYRKYRLNFYIMFFTIFICNTVSFVPSMVYLLLHENDIEFFFSHDTALVNVHLSLHRLYVTNHVLNPFIYGYFDLTFRKNVIETFRNLCRRRNALDRNIPISDSTRC